MIDNKITFNADNVQLDQFGWNGGLSQYIMLSLGIKTSNEGTREMFWLIILSQWVQQPIFFFKIKELKTFYFY